MFGFIFFVLAVWNWSDGDWIPAIACTATALAVAVYLAWESRREA